MTSTTEAVVRAAAGDDVTAICRFGETHIAAHYTPLIGSEAAEAQVRRWWTPDLIGAAVDEGLVVVAELAGEVVAVGQRGRHGAEHVIYKLYVHPVHRGVGLGPRVLDALIRDLPEDVGRVYIEHFVANHRAGEFYERQGFTVDRIQPGPSGAPALGVVWRARQPSGQLRADH